MVGVYSQGEESLEYGIRASAGSIYLRPCVVESWGAKAATLKDLTTGEMIREKINPEHAANRIAGTPEEVAVLVAKCQDDIHQRRGNLASFHPVEASALPFLGHPARVESYAILADEIHAHLIARRKAL